MAVNSRSCLRNSIWPGGIRNDTVNIVLQIQGCGNRAVQRKAPDREYMISSIEKLSVCHVITDVTVAIVTDITAGQVRGMGRTE